MVTVFVAANGRAITMPSNSIAMVLSFNRLIILLFSS